VIPCTLFVGLMRQRGAVMAEERLQLVRAVALAIAETMNGEDAKVRAADRALVREAYPEG
jgi:hypothetical protein